MDAAHRSRGLPLRLRRANDQFAHPAAAYVLTADGMIARVLSGLALDGATCAWRWSTAGQGKVGTFGDQVRLLCYGFDPALGIYTDNVGCSRRRRCSPSLLLGGGIACMTCATRRREAP